MVNKQGEQKKTVRAHGIENATHTTNHALQFFHGVGPDLSYFVGLTFEQKIVGKDLATGKWGPNAEGQVLCAYQIPENDGDGNGYHARSFEDAFFHVNRAFIRNSTTEEPNTQKAGFPSLVGKHLKNISPVGRPSKWPNMASPGNCRLPSKSSSTVRRPRLA